MITYRIEMQAQAIALSVQDGQFGAYGLKITGDQ